MLDRVLSHPELMHDPILSSEAWFYALLHRSIEQRPEALQRLKALLQSGARSPAWDFSTNLEQARKEGRADMPWLEKLAAVITRGADIATLDDWPAWRDAG